MCIIAIKERHSKYPTIDRVKTMCRNNRDGFALAYHTDEAGVNIYRTMDVKLFLAKYEEVINSHDEHEIALFIHARIGTHGSISLANCHGWKDDDLGLCFAHNGILSIDSRDDLTDSETFFRDIFAPIYENYGWEGAELAINAVIGSSKFVFLDTLGRLIHYGNYIKDEDDGCLYSNSTYIDWGTRSYNTGTCALGNRWDSSLFEKNRKHKKKEEESKKGPQSFDEYWDSFAEAIEKDPYAWEEYWDYEDGCFRYPY